MEKVYIYALSCPDSGRVRYIGKANNPKTRLQTHIRTSNKKRKTKVVAWVESLTAANKWPVMTILVETDTENWQSEEIRLIAQYRASHSDLLNIADGGVGPYKTRASNGSGGRAAAIARVADPVAELVYYLKTEIGKNINWLRKHDQDGYKRMCDLIRPLAAKYPRHFGTWKGV